MVNKTAIPPTVNIHSLVPCNYSCGYCYAGFRGVRPVLPQAELHSILRLLAQAPLPSGSHARKITFAGGEPLLARGLADDLAVAKAEGLATSLVTNGSLLDEALLKRLARHLDWLTISIDSLLPETNLKIGRCHSGRIQSAEAYSHKLIRAKEYGIRTKVNTVVSALNVSEDFSKFINIVQPLRWKLFQVTRIHGENDSGFSRWAVSDDQFLEFVECHRKLTVASVPLVPETQEDIYGSYAMIAPNGCFFDNSEGHYRYSRPILEVGVVEAFTDINFSWEGFDQRGGNYDPVCKLPCKEPK